MGQNPSSGNLWVDISGLAINGLSARVNSWTVILDGREIQRQMGQTEPVVRTCESAVTSYLGRRNIIEHFGLFLSGLDVTAHFLEVWQGVQAQSALEDIGACLASEVEAQTGLIAPDKFAKQIYRFITQQTTIDRPDRRIHIFFLYHPNTGWDRKFFDRARKQPLSRKFLGMSENMDALVIWMRFLKENLTKAGKKIHIHLLIPAYRPMLIGESLAFPDELLPLTIHGHIHHSKPYVWLNLPSQSSRLRLRGIGNLADLPHDEGDGSGIGTFLVGVGATVAAGLIGGPVAAGAVGMATIGNAVGSRPSTFVSDGEPRTLGEEHTGEFDDVLSSYSDEERPAWRVEPTSRRLRRKYKHWYEHRGYY